MIARFANALIDVEMMKRIRKKDSKLMNESASDDSILSGDSVNAASRAELMRDARRGRGRRQGHDADDERKF